MAAIRVERRVLDEKISDLEISSRAANVEDLSGAYTDPRTNIVTGVRRIVAANLSMELTLKLAAALLSTHPRTVQRKLAEAGTSFEAVRDDVRREAAHRLITNTELPLGTVSELVGFTEQSSLSHAVRRWFDVSPRSLRAATGFNLSH